MSRWAALATYDDRGERTAELLTDDPTLELVTIFQSRAVDDWPTEEELSSALATYGDGSREYLIVPLGEARVVSVKVERRLEVIATGNYVSSPRGASVS